MRNLLVVAVVVVVDIGFGWVDIVGILQVDIEVVVGIEFDLVGIVEIVQAVLVVGSTDLVFDHNNFTMNDTFTPAGSPSYLYAFTFGVDEGITVSNNNFYLETQGGKNGEGTAYALQIVSATMDIISNNITSVSNGPNLGIYAVLEYNTFDNDFYLNIKDNNINITGYRSCYEFVYKIR